MASQTTTQKREQTRIEPRDQQMRQRLGFDRRGLRREFAGVEDLSLSDKYIETEDRRFINPTSTDLPAGPSGMGETGGTGVEMYVEEGDQWQTFRFTHGFSVLQEDLEASNDSVAQQRDEVLEIFDFFADSLFMTGIEDRAGNQIKPGMLEYLKSNIPAERTFDCEDYDGDSGDDDYTDDPENLLFYDAYSEVSGNLLNSRNSQWDLMVGRQPALANFNRIRDTSAGADRGTYWQKINSPDAIGGVSDWTVIPDQMEYPYTPEGVDPLSVDLSSYLGEDEVILLPDMDTVRQNYWRLNEMDTPRSFDMHQEGGGQMRQDYAWRYLHRMNPEGHKRWAALEDAVYLKNVSALFT